MNIPLDRLYHYIENVSREIYGDSIIIYRFWPHGSKNINDLNYIHSNETNQENPKLLSWEDGEIYPLVWCYDQEPLDYKFYRANIRKYHENKFSALLTKLNLNRPPTNLNYRRNIFEKGLLLHSEKRSSNLEKYQQDNELIPVYYWSHAIIARDWFRYAEHENFQKNTKKTFLIYNRAWSGTREYRLKFAELLIRSGLETHCQTSVNPIEPELGVHYEIHKFKNPIWRPNFPLENFFPVTQAKSHYSADFETNDYNSTDIEVVLETLFDDDRLHLTEKSLRPIACGQPFILAGTHGSLEYLRSYGFKTFGLVWDERYDECADPEERLIKIADLMKQIANWHPWLREQKMAEARAIAEYNRQHFFSQEFFIRVVEELKTNLENSFTQLNLCNNYQPWITRWSDLLSHPEIVEFLKNNQGRPTLANVEAVMQIAQHKLAIFRGQ
jgi:hypothetical protein